MTGDVAVCLVVPNGTWNLGPLIAAIRVDHPDRSVVAVWGGDPHRRPALPVSLRVTWCDLELVEPSGAGWNRLLVGLAPRTYEWARTAAGVARLLDDGVGSVAVVRVGSVAVLGDLAALFGDSPITLLARALVAMPADGLAPTEADVIAQGRHSTALAGFRGGAQPALGWLVGQLLEAGDEVGPWLDRMAELFGSDDCPSTSVVAAGWPNRGGLGDGSSMTLADVVDVVDVVDLEHLDRDEPWAFRFGQRRRASGCRPTRCSPPRCRPDGSNAGGSPLALMLPGAIPVDGPVRSLMQRALRAWRAGDGELPPPEPYGPNNSAFTRWLEQSEPSGADVGRYWLAVREERPDLQAAFPQPQADDASGLLEWAAASWRLEQRTAILRGHATTTFADALAKDPDHAIRSAGFDPTGINVLGYLDFDQSQGHIARQLVAALRAANVPVAPLNHHRSLGSKRPRPVARERAATFATNLVVVNADQFVFVAADYADSLLNGRKTIAYWFWELEHVPASLVRAIEHVDEIWTGSQFVADAFAAVTDKPVHCAPIPVAEPQPSDRKRASFGIPDDRFVFLATFDQFSVPERKNPFGVIEAFTTAFAENEGPLLWIKTMNGTRGWRNHERLLLAASQRDDIVVWDEHLTRADQMAVVNAADCLVSLHRSEGLGLHCAEAMWLSKPVIATRYSGNMDFMDDSCSALVGYEMVPVRHGEGIYPETAFWAEPHVDEAASWMRQLATDRGRAAEIGHAGRVRMLSQTSAADTGLLMARLACLEPTRG